MGLKNSIPLFNKTKTQLTKPDSKSKVLENFELLPVRKEKLLNENSLKISIVCYNILASCYCDPGHFRSSEPAALDFKKRSSKIVMILNYKVTNAL